MTEKLLLLGCNNCSDITMPYEQPCFCKPGVRISKDTTVETKWISICMSQVVCCTIYNVYCGLSALAKAPVHCTYVYRPWVYGQLCPEKKASLSYMLAHVLQCLQMCILYMLVWQTSQQNWIGLCTWAVCTLVIWAPVPPMGCAWSCYVHTTALP